MDHLPDRAVVTDLEAAAVFAKARPRAILFALMRSERSAQELRRELGLSLSLLDYHLHKLRGLGLVQIVRRAPRAGRPVRFYRATARSFVTPTLPGDAATGSSPRAELRAALERVEARSASEVLYCLGEDGAPRTIRVAGPGEQIGEGEWWWRLKLSRRDAAELGREVRALVERYRERTSDDGRRYLTSFALAQL